MKHFVVIFLTTVFCFLIFGSKGQVNVTNPGNTTPALSATYGSLALAITAVNSRTAISGPVTITLTVNETAPAGGYSITATPTGISATNKFIFDGGGNTITAFTPQSSGLLTDAIFKIIGADYITIQNFTMQENASNTTSAVATNNMTEWGVALLYATTTNGAQNNTIQNNIISLNRTYQNTFGIYSNSRHNATTVTTAVDPTSTAGANSGNKVYGNAISNVNAGISFVGAGNVSYMDIGNDIGGTSAATGNTITNWGGATTAVSTYVSNSGTFHGIFMNHQKDNNASYNTITSAAISGTTFNLRAIHNRYASNAPTGTFSTTISNNTITLTNANTGGTFEAILSEQITAVGTATVNITNNTILNCSSSSLAFVGINNTSIASIANINGNIFRGNTSAGTTVGFTAINNTGAVYTTLNINNNKLGDASGNAITFSNATTATIYGINCPTVAATTAVSISGNNFQGFNQTVAGSGIHVYINLSHAPSTATTDNINNNTFTNLTARTSNNVIFINRTGAMASNAGATQNCNNNSIITGFSKPVAGGYVSLYNTGQTCLSGNTMNETGNNFSNITLTGVTDMYGWDNEEGTAASGPTKNISNNTFQNWNCADGAVNVIQSDYAGTGTIISGNTIDNITTTSAIEGIYYGVNSKLTHTISNNNISSLTSANSVWGISGGTTSASNIVNITGNNIHTIASTGFFTSAGIRIAGAVTLNISKNKIYDISASNSVGLANGIELATSTTGATYNVSNNTIGDIKASLTNNALAVIGIKVTAVAVTSTYNIYYNTIYLNATSSGTNFGTACFYTIASGTATTGAVTLRNNIFVNTSTANGTGVTAAYRRSATNLTNYVSASNNNIFYGGVPSATNLIFYDGTNSDQTLATYKTRVSTRDAASFTELPPFLSTSGASASFLHLNTAIATLAESGGANIAGYTDDFDGDIRFGNAGSTSTGTAPDIGADEANFTPSEANPPSITYTALSSSYCSIGNSALIGVTITDATGVPLSGVNVPRIYYRKNAGAWFSRPGTNTGGTSTNSTWDFSIVVTDMGGVTGNDVISYYVIAQDLIPFPNVTSNPAAGLVAAGVNTVSTHPTSPNTYTIGYILNGTYTVGTGGYFTTLTAAVNAYNNACLLTGPVIFELIDNSYATPAETFPITINNHADASATNTLTIRPSATAVPVITGNLTTFTINLSGAKYIRIDGRQGGVGTTKTLTITNSSTATAINFVDEAQNNIVRYCNVKGQRVSTVTGTINFSTTAAVSGTGNDNNSIDNNDISEVGGFSNIGISCAGTSGKENDNISITNNNISNFYNATANSFGIYVNTGGSGWTITGNRVFQTATRVYTGTCSQFGIYVNTGSGYTISNNVVGFSNAAGTGTTNMIGNSLSLSGFPSSYSNSGTPQQIRYLGIGVANQAGTTSYIDGNTIAGFAMYTSSTASTNYGIFGGIYVESGNVNIGSVAGNTIGATSGNNSIYVATSGAGGTVVGIRSGGSGNTAIQNNTMGSIMVSGTGATVSGSFTGISLGSSANYTISNNAIGNADADNICTGYMATAGLLSNTGSLVATSAGSVANFKGITSGGSLSTALTISNNTLRGWAMSCAGTVITGIETSGLMLGGAVNINNNFIGTAATNWLNSIVDNTAFLYAITIANTGATTTNIKNNDIRGTIFGTKNGIGGGLIKLTGASSANNIATISGNTFTNLAFRFSTANLYFIFANYSIASTGQLIIDNNRTVGTFNSTGTSAYYMIQCIMSSSSGAKTDITNNDFSNITAATGFSSDMHGVYTYYNGNPCLLTITNNTFNNWAAGIGGATGIEVSDMSGTANCNNNIVTNFATQGDIEGISLSSTGTSGLFNVNNNTVSGYTSAGAGGYVYGISGYFPTAANTTQSNIYNNTINSYSSTSPTGKMVGIFLSNGSSSGTISITKNKIYDLTETAAGGHTYGIYNENSFASNTTYSNNYIGDLRAPNSNVTPPAVAGMRLYMIGGQAKVYFNTIYLNATGTPSVFSTAAVYADAATDVTLRNNIFTNISSHGATGRTVAYWRGDTNLGTYDAASNNNLFYAGTPSSQNLIFYDGTNSDQTLAAYQTRVSPKDNLSVSALPGFISTTGSNANFLHIAATGNCAVNARGSNSGILLASDYDNDLRSTTTPFITDIGADEFSKKNSWTGANGTNWNDIANWSSGTVPNGIEENVIISNPPANQPVIATGETYQVASLAINTGASLTNKGTLKISGTVYAPISGINNTQAGVVEGSVEMNGNCSMPQTCAGNIFSNNDVKNFTVSNDVTISSVAGEHLNIIGTLAFGATGKTFTTGDNIVLRSTQSATANIADVTGNIISGKASVERYINTGLVANGQHIKSWQFLSTPTVGQTIYQSWQESGTTPVGYGTIITGTGSGFDITTALPSMKFFINSTALWQGVTSTASPVNDQRGYMILVRGDRSVTAYNQAATPTALRTKGTLYQPTAAPPVSTVQAGKFESIGNPYASAINVQYMKDNGLFVNLTNNVWVWDPLLNGSNTLGGYQALSAANNYEPTAGSIASAYYQAGVQYPYIQSGNAFFVHSSGSAGSVTFTEACKEGSNRLVNRTPILQDFTRQYFRATLFTQDGIIADGNAVVFDPVFANAIDADDAYKIANPGENFGMLRNANSLSVEARNPVVRRDTIFYSISNLRHQPYQLRFAPKNMFGTNLAAFLIDKYLNSETRLSLVDSSFVNINITDDALSYASDRFYVVFRLQPAPGLPGTLPGHHISRSAKGKPNPVNNIDANTKEAVISVYPNPVENHIIQLHFSNQPAGAYRIELVNNLGQPVYNGNAEINDAYSKKPIRIANSISPGVYQLNIYDEKGKKTLIQVVIK
ncbi:MAG: hypothetical protein QM737_08845 [Ferruginibacter sp.]